MSKKNELRPILETLNILKIARNSLVSDFLNKKQDIYLSMFKYECHDTLMKMSIESYFTTWINIHFQLFDKYHDSNNPNNFFFKKVKNLIKDMLPDINELNSYNKNFYSNLIASKIELLNKVIETGEQDNKKYNSLLLEYEKDKVLFQREINRINRGL